MTFTDYTLSLLHLLESPQAQHPEIDQAWNDDARRILATLDDEALKTFAANAATLANVARKLGRDRQHSVAEEKT